MSSAPLPKRKVGCIALTGLRLGIVLQKLQRTECARNKTYSDYIKNSEFETMNVFERENNYGNQLNQNDQMTRPDQNIQMTRIYQNIQMI